MTVKELIKQLQKFDENKLVFCQEVDEDVCADILYILDFPENANKVLITSQTVDLEDERFE